MSIVTRTGDSGHTALMFNRRVSKTDAHVEACGTVDELNAALGLARALLCPGQPGEIILSLQGDLVGIMGELATASEDQLRYQAGGYRRLTPEMTARLEQVIHALETQGQALSGWATPGTSTASASLDLARTIARRAERRVCALQEKSQLHNPEVLVYLNRLSDLLWLMARAVEAPLSK
jgi:cob(I)alamin adenosyltransferase